MKCLLIYNPYLTSSISPPFINPNVIYSTYICTNFSRVNSNRTAAPLVTSDLTGLSHRIRFHPSLIRLSLCKNRLATERGCATKNHRKEGYSGLKKKQTWINMDYEIPKTSEHYLSSSLVWWVWYGMISVSKSSHIHLWQKGAQIQSHAVPMEPLWLAINLEIQTLGFLTHVQPRTKNTTWWFTPLNQRFIIIRIQAFFSE